MSAITYPQPYRLPAGILALAVHIAFLALLYFGVSWQVQPPQGMVVDIWESLPATEAVPAKVEPMPVKQAEPPRLATPPKPVEPVRPAMPSKADIELAEKKKQHPKPVEIKKPPEIKKTVEVKNPLDLKKTVEMKKPVVPQIQAVPQVSETEKAAQSAQAEQARARAEQAAAIGKVVDEYKGKIVAKVRRNIVQPPDVPDKAKAEFEVTLLPGGSLLRVKLVKSSGNAAYDSAVERAIYKSEPLPLPPDVALFNKFRELHLIFSPVE
jgi:colicin import membrane protein